MTVAPAFFSAVRPGAGLYQHTGGPSMKNERRLLYALRAGHALLAIVLLGVTICGAIGGSAFFFRCIFYLKYFLVLVPQILDLAMILFSFYLMLDGVRRWGHELDGAFSRSLIGLFILHASSVHIPFVPYLALFIEAVICLRNGRQAKSESEKSQSLGYSLQG